jgi:hypothetical protein
LTGTVAPGASTVVADDQTCRRHLGGARDRRHGFGGVAGSGRRRCLPNLHPVTSHGWRSRPVSLPKVAAPPLVSGGSADRDAAEAVLAVLGVGAVFVALWPLLVMVAAGVPVDPVALLAHVSGMLAGYGVLVMLVLMSRWPLLERGIGADVLARWHARGGRTILTLVLVHGVFAIVAWSLLTAQDPISALAQVLTWPGLLTATIGTALLCAVAVASARSARSKLRWETWYSLHLSMYVAVALSFSHQLAGPDLAGRAVASDRVGVVVHLHLRPRLALPIHWPAARRPTPLPPGSRGDPRGSRRGLHRDPGQISQWARG